MKTNPARRNETKYKSHLIGCPRRNLDEVTIIVDDPTCSCGVRGLRRIERKNKTEMRRAKLERIRIALES